MVGVVVMLQKKILKKWTHQTRYYSKSKNTDVGTGMDWGPTTWEKINKAR